MSLENSLERIANALEVIAKSKTGLEAAAKNPDKDAEVSKPESQRTRPGKKIEEAVVEKIADDEEDAQIDESLKQVHDGIAEEIDPDLKWPDINKKLFAMLGKVREEVSHEEAKAVCAGLMKKYSGGKQFSESAVNPSSYRALLADIEKELVKLNG